MWISGGSFGGGSESKESTCNVGDPSSIPGLGRSPGEGNGNPLQYSCLENSMERSLAGYIPWGCKELDTTEQLMLSLSPGYLFQRNENLCLHIILYINIYSSLSIMVGKWKQSRCPSRGEQLNCDTSVLKNTTQH